MVKLDGAAEFPEAVTAIMRAGIPVFTADISAHGGKVVSHVASDNVQGGRLAAEALAGFMGDKMIAFEVGVGAKVGVG